MMSADFIRNTFPRRMGYLLIGVLFVVNSSSLGYGQTINVGGLLGLRDRGELNRIIGEAEKVFNKNPKDKNSLLTLGVACHNLAGMKVKDASGKCVEYLTSANKLYPEDALALAVLGSCVTMTGRDSSSFVDKIRYVHEGTPMIDKAVTMAPDDVFVRMVRAEDSAGLPKFFGRTKYMKEDLLHIEGIIKKSPQDTPKDFQAEVYYRLGRVFKTEGDDSSAKAYFKKAVEVLPNSEWGKKAKNEL